MGLTNDLISQFAKAVTVTKKTDSESTVFGTVVEYSGSKYVQIDGSDLLTPVETTAGIKDGERVTVMIKNHTATVTGNITSPSASGNDVKEVDDKITDYSDKISEFEIVIADKVSVDELDAQVARIDTLYSDNVVIKEKLTANEGYIKDLEAENVVITEKLTAAEADIENLETTKLDAEVADITYATIENLEATNADIYNLEVVYGDFEDLTTKELNAINATIDNLDAKYATITDLDVERARIDDLEAISLTAESAIIKTLQADIADIDTLIFGSASGNVIQTSFANAVIAQLGNAQIKSAMIESVSADKITAGDIITNNVRVMSEDGKLLISDETIQISDETRVRVQIGKDAAGDYSISIWDADGNLMFSEGGITDSAIKEAIIRDDMVSDTANISAHKLNIASLFEEINGSAHTIQSSKILMDADNQTLDVVFTEMTTDLTELEELVNTQGTSLSVVQGQISSKVWQQDIDTAIDNIEVGGRNLFGFHKGVGITPLAKTSTIAKNEDSYGVAITVTNESNSILMRIDRLGFNVINGGQEPFTFSATMYASAACQISMDICDVGRTYMSLTETPQKISFTAYPAITYASADSSYNGFVDLEGVLPVGTIIYLEKIKIERGTKATDFTVAPEDLEYVTDGLDDRTNTLSTKYSSLEQTVDGINVIVADHTTLIAEKADQKDVIAVEEQVAQLDLTVDEFKTTVSNTYATKDALGEVDNQVTLNKTSIQQNTEAIKLRVTKTEMENAISNIDVGGRNLVLGTSEIISFPDTEEFVTYSKYKTYKFSPIIADDVKGFLYSLRNGESFTVSYDINIPRIYKNSAYTLSRIGIYIPFLLTHTDGTKNYWYGTHSGGGVTTNRHTITTMSTNSMVSLQETEQAFVGRYSCYLTPTEIEFSYLQDFYENPDNYTVSVAGICLECHGYTTGGTISNIKMEIGNKATDWTPAPEDLETRVTNAESQIIQNAESIASIVSRTTETEKDISTLEQTASSLTSRVSTAEKTISGNTVLATNAQNTADDAQTAAANAQADIDDLEIGGRNLALSTAEGKSHTMANSAGNDSWNACNSYWTHGIVLEIGQTYTISFDYVLEWGDVAIPTAASQIGPGIGSDNGTNAPGSYIADTFAMVADLWNYGSGKYESGRFVYTFTNTKSTELYFAFRMLRSYTYDITGITMTISNFKLEIGNRATDWTPSPDDMATSDELATVQSSAELTEARVTTAESLIQQLSDSIAMLVTDGNGESLMVQTENGWTFSTGEIQNAVDATSENLANLTDEMGSVNSTVGALQQAVNDLGILNDYVKIGTYEDEPCIELGESDSDFKLIITNTRIMFMEGSSVPAYINNQSLFIKKAVIEEELQQGEFVWKARSNGNLGLIWKGVS